MTADPVLIAGAGPTGLTLALTLLRNDVPVRIIQKDTSYGVGMRGPGVQPRTLEMYKFLGILDEVMEESCPSQAIQQYTSPEDGKPPKRIEMSGVTESTPDCPYINARILPQDHHEAILRSHLQKEYGCKVELGTRLESFEQYTDHVIACIVKTAEDGREVTEEARVAWLIGADGAHSVVRKGLGCTFLGESPPQVAFVTGDIHLKNGWGHEYCRAWGDIGGSKTVVLRPFPKEGDTRHQFFVGGPAVDTVQISTSRETLIQAIFEITGRDDFDFGELVWMGVWKPNIRMVNTFGIGRVFIAGDAAHVHSPTGGQGLNSGVQDSFNLAWKLSLIYKGLAPQTILETYSHERLPVIASMLDKTTLLFNQLFKSTSRKAGQELPWARGNELKQFGINYRGSRIVVDEKQPPAEILDAYRKGLGEPIRAGDRAPDAPGLVRIQVSATPGGELEAVSSLFDIFKLTYHTVLIFVPELSDIATTRVQSLLETLSFYPQGTVKSAIIFSAAASGNAPIVSTSDSVADFSFVDRDGYAYRHYGVNADEMCTFVVRPDGYVGALLGAEGSEGIKTYFKGIFIQ